MMYGSLLEAQMGEYPDSLVLPDEQMYDALVRATPDWISSAKFENWSWYEARHEMNEVYAKVFFDEWKRLQVEQERARWARTAFMYRSDYPQGFFYACGKQADGSYRYVGFRFGPEDCAYASGFAGMTYTPEGASR